MAMAAPATATTRLPRLFVTAKAPESLSFLSPEVKLSSVGEALAELGLVLEGEVAADAADFAVGEEVTGGVETAA